MTDIREETNSQETPREELSPNWRAEMPPGSTVVQILLRPCAPGETPELLIEGVLCGTEIFDPTNPCHRFLAVIADRLPELMAEIGATQMTNEVAPPAGVAANDPTAGDDVAAG